MAEDIVPPAENASTEEAPVTSLYKDDDLVYVDPHARTVVGLVEWLPSGKPKAMPVKTEVVEDVPGEPTEAKDVKDEKGKRRKAPMRQRYYPWGTYRSMKRVYKIEGKQIKAESPYTLDQVMEKALKEPFWD